MEFPTPPEHFWHIPVLYHEVLYYLQPHPGGRYVDGTLGAGGHAWGILKVSAPDGQLLGMDVDPQAMKLAEERLSVFGGRFRGIIGSYTSLRQRLDDLGWDKVDGIVLDLGVSSIQLDTPERGFSFQIDAPLDMRFDPSNPVTAADLVNTLDESALADLLFRYGEERQAVRLAHAIVQARPINTTRKLAEIIASVLGGRRRQHIHPATRSFQALRIAVNRELEALESVLPIAVEALSPGGRLAIIAFHSLEDRLVKQFFRKESQDCICPSRQPFCTCGHKASLRELTRHPVRPQAIEVQRNPRARSARLRVAEKL